MFCPKCKAEYRPGFTRCSDCDMELVCELPKTALAAPEAPPEPSDPDEDPFVSFWQGDDPRLHAELRQLLSENGIPQRTIRREDHLFRFSARTAFEIGIPFSRFSQAESIVQEAYSVDPAKSPENGSVLLALPESTEPVEPPSARERGISYNEDATAQVWEGAEQEMAELLAAALNENNIGSRIRRWGQTHGLLVLPEDENRAREIVREVVEGMPPQ